VLVVRHASSSARRPAARHCLERLAVVIAARRGPGRREAARD